MIYVGGVEARRNKKSTKLGGFCDDDDDLLFICRRQEMKLDGWIGERHQKAISNPLENKKKRRGNQKAIATTILKQRIKAFKQEFQNRSGTAKPREREREMEIRKKGETHFLFCL